MILQGIRGECTSHCVTLAFRVAVFILSAQHVTDVTAVVRACGRRREQLLLNTGSKRRFARMPLVCRCTLGMLTFSLNKELLSRGRGGGGGSGGEWGVPRRHGVSRRALLGCC